MLMITYFVKYSYLTYFSAFWFKRRKQKYLKAV